MKNPYWRNLRFEGLGLDGGNDMGISIVEFRFGTKSSYREGHSGRNSGDKQTELLVVRDEMIDVWQRDEMLLVHKVVSA